VGSSSSKRRKPKQTLPPVPHYVPYPKQTGIRWRLGGPLTSDHESEARAEEVARGPGRVGRFMWRLLGGGKLRSE
jgi:hypothetical protein